MKNAAKRVSQAGLEAFDRWFSRSGHWVYSSREAAFETWRLIGINGLPPYMEAK